MPLLRRRAAATTALTAPRRWRRRIRRTALLGGAVAGVAAWRKRRLADSRAGLPPDGPGSRLGSG